MIINTPLVLDVGANDGLSTSHMLNDDIILLSFEPHPECNQRILNTFGSRSNFISFYCAVSDFDGEAKFMISAQDGACSSLLDFREGYEKDWPNRPDISKVKEITVPVKRLDTILDGHSNFIGPIKYLHIDTQGSDLKVLQGLGRHLNRVQQGVMEAAAKKDVLYKGQNTIDESTLFLATNGFEVVDIVDNDPQQNEVNIHFRRSKT